MATDCLGAIWKYWWRGGLKYFFSQPKTLHLPERHMVCFPYMYKRNTCFVFNVLHSIFSFIVLLILIIMLCLIGNHAGIDDAHGVQDRLGRANLWKAKAHSCHCRIHLHWPLDHWLLGWGPGQWSMVGWLCFRHCADHFFPGLNFKWLFHNMSIRPAVLFQPDSGSGNGLLGESGIPLAIWVAERVYVGEDHDSITVSFVDRITSTLELEWNTKTQWHNDNDDMIMVRMYIHVYMTVD